MEQMRYLCAINFISSLSYDNKEEHTNPISLMASKLLEAGLLVGGVILAYLLIRYLPYLLGRLLDFLKIPHYARKPMDYEATKELEGQMLEKERLGSEANEVYQSRQSF